MNQTTPGIALNTSNIDRRQPATKNRNRHMAHIKTILAIFTNQEERIRRGRIFGHKTGNQRAFASGRSNGGRLVSAKRRDEEDDKHREQRYTNQTVSCCAIHNIRQVQRSDAEQHGDNDKARWTLRKRPFAPPSVVRPRTDISSWRPNRP